MKHKITLNEEITIDAAFTVALNHCTSADSTQRKAAQELMDAIGKFYNAFDVMSDEEDAAEAEHRAKIFNVENPEITESDVIYHTAPRGEYGYCEDVDYDAPFGYEDYYDTNE